VPGRRAAPGPMEGRWRSSGRGKGLSAGMCEYCRLQGRSAEMCRSLGHVVADTPVDALAHARGHGRPAGERCDACLNAHRSAVHCKKRGHIPEQLEDADQPSVGRPMPSSGRPAGMRFAVICNACIKAKRSAKKCKDLGHQEPPEEAGMEAAAAGLSAHNLFGSQAAAGSFCRAASGPSADSHLNPQAGLLERAAGGPPDGVEAAAAGLSAHNLCGSQAAAGSFCRAASGPSADSHLDPQAGLLERAAGGPADGVRSGAADVRRRQPAKIVRRASGRREVAAVVATIARTMGLCVEEEKDLSSWAKIAFWLQEQRAITDLFGRLHVPHSLFQMEGSRYSTIDSRHQLEVKAKEYKGGDLLEGFSVAQLRSLWPSGEICPGSRERMLEGAFRIEMRASRPPADIIAGFLLEEHTLPIHRVVAGMSLSDLQIYVCQRWEEMFKAYKNNVLAINTYVRKLEEREELVVDTEHRFRINAMCRLMRCGFSRTLFTVQERSEAGIGWDWVFICETDQTVSEALSAGASKQELVQCGLVDGCVNLEAMKRCGEQARHRLQQWFTPIRRKDAILEMCEQSLGQSIKRPGLNLTRAEEQRIHGDRKKAAFAHMESFAKWESTIFIDKCDICGRFVLGDKAQGTCKSIGDQLVNDKNTGERKCGICAAARKRALERHKSDDRTGDLHPGLRDPWSHSNGMMPSLVPQELQVLTMVEKLMIALIAPLMRIKFLRKGTRALNGNGIAFRQPVENLARALPRYVSETSILLVVRGLVADEDKQNVSSGAREWKLRRAPVRNALQYLITHSPPYMDPRNRVVIDEGRLTCIPEDGSVFDAVLRQQQRAAFQQWRTSNSVQQCADCNLPLSECSCHIRHLQDDGLGGSDEEGCLGPAPGQHVMLEGSESEGCVDEWGKYDISEQYVDQEEAQRRLLQGMGVPVRSAAGLNECEPVNLQFGQTDKINETTPYYFSMAFPALFPDGRGDISAPNHVHGFATSGTSIGDYHTWMSILFRFHDNRFAEDAGFALLVNNIVQRRQSKGGALSWQKNRLDDNDPSLQEVADAGIDKVEGMFKSVFAQTANLKGTRAYWGNVRRTLEAIMRHQIHRGKSLPSFFISASCAEFHHADLARVIAQAAALKPQADSWESILEQMNRDEKFRRSLVRKYSGIVCEYFTLKTRQFLAAVLGPVFDLFQFFLRFEFAKGRGTIHFHMLGYRNDRKPHSLFPEAEGNLHHLEVLLEEFLSALGFNCWAPEDCEVPEPEGTRRGPEDPNVLRRTYAEIVGSKRKQDDIDWMLRHHVCSSYCLCIKEKKSRRQDGTVGSDVKCRFFDIWKSAMVRVEGKPGYYVTADHRPPTLCGKLRKNHKGVLVYDQMRNHPRILQEPAQMIHLWRANVDFAPVISMDDPDAPSFEDTTAVADYVCSYNCKENPEGMASIQAYKDHTQILSEQQPGRPLSSLAQTLMALSVGEREVPLQQALHEGTGLPAWFSSFQTVFLTLGSGRRLQKTSGKNKTSDKEPAYSGLAKNIVDRYTYIVCNGAEHPHDFVESVSGENISVQDISLYDYASTGPQSNHPIGTYVPVASGLGYLKAVYPLRPCFCLSMLRLYKPGFTWGGSIIEGADGGPSVEQVIEFQSFLLEDACPSFVWADCQRAEAKHLCAGDKKKRRTPERQEGADNEISDESSTNVDGGSEDEELRVWAQAMSFRADEGQDMFEECGKFVAFDFSKLKLGSAEMLAKGIYSIVRGHENMRGVEYWSQTQCWFKSHLNLLDSIILVPKPASPWSLPQLLGANIEQRQALSVIMRHFQLLLDAAHSEGTQPWLVQSVAPLRLIISGTAGTGKSFILRAASYIAEMVFGGVGAAVSTAPSGCAADNAGGVTTFAFAGLHPDRLAGKSSKTGQQALKMQSRCKGLIILFIDEMSMISCSALADFEESVRGGVQLGRSSTSLHCFGKLPIVVLLGDHGQLGPCESGAVRLCDSERSLIKERDKRGRLIYLQFTNAIFLEKMQRQSDIPKACWSCPPEFHAPGKRFTDLNNIYTIRGSNVYDVYDPRIVRGSYVYVYTKC